MKHRDALVRPLPDESAMAEREYEAPVGEVEMAIASIWAKVLQLERVGRHDNFFELGGHSLLVLPVIERLRQQGIGLEVRAIFVAPTVMALASALAQNGGPSASFVIPLNLIRPDSPRITPEMLPLVEMGQEEIDRIVASVPKGVANIQDIYPLAPLQESILFHPLLQQEGDAYIMRLVMAFGSRERLDGFLRALQMVIDRHDILRSAIRWEGLSQAVQVVYREAALLMEELRLEGDSDDVLEQLLAQTDPRRMRLDLKRAPLLAAYVTADSSSGRWLLALLNHYLVSDHVTLELILEEIQLVLERKGKELPVPVPYRNFIAQLKAMGSTEHEEYFRRQLGDVDEPTAPFGVLDVRCDGEGVEEARLSLSEVLARRIREAARREGVTPAVLFHVAWAEVLAQCSGRDDVVFGTVLSGRLQGSDGADRVLGMFINTLPVRIKLGERSVREAVCETYERLGELLAHEQASLALAQRCSGIAPPLRLFTALLNYRHIRERRSEHTGSNGFRGISVIALQQLNNYPLTLSVDDLGGEFALEVRCIEHLDPARLVAYVRSIIEALVEALHDSPTKLTRTLEMLSQAERRQLVTVFNSRRCKYSERQVVHELFEAQVERTPNALAIVFGTQSLTYAQLNAKANQLAHYLVRNGVSADKVIGIGAERSLEMVIGLMAILKAGGAYLPLDPSYPRDRLASMINDSKPSLILTQERFISHWPTKSEKTVLCLDRDWDSIAAYPECQVDAKVAPDDLAYVVYTSGSTGRAKGVMISHESISNHMCWLREAFPLNVADIVLQKTPFGFDAAIWDFFAALLTGAKLLMAEPGREFEVHYLIDLIVRHDVTTVKLVPTLLQRLIQCPEFSRCTSLTRVFSGGEELPGDVSCRFFDALPETELYNQYGPTEAAVDVTYYQCVPSDRTRKAPIGRPIANTQIYILDRHLEPVPLGVTGELYIGGVQVARGYLNRPELTAERFIADPISSEAGARLYRTGDLGRWLPDGNIEFIGRNDFQVKIRGFRIELGEIEARLAKCAGVREAVVVAREDTPGEKRLAGYVVAEEGVDLSLVELRGRLSAALPQYMVPSAFVVMKGLPLTPNGKLDRKSLPAPDQGSVVRREYGAPQGEIESRLVEIWAELLKVERVGRYDNFFELGGHSLLAVKLMERLRRVGLEAEIRWIFTESTLAALAAMVRRRAQEIEIPPNLIPEQCEAITSQMLPLVELTCQEIEQVVSTVSGGAPNVQDIYPLTPLQEGILFHHLMSEQGDPYVLAAVSSFDSRARLDGYLAALQKVIDRHDVLRTAVVWQGLREPMQVVWRQAPLIVKEVVLDETGAEAAEQLRQRFNPRHIRLDVTQAPLLRGYIAHDWVQNRWLLLSLLHHLAGDHVTLEVMDSEIRAHLLGQALRLLTPKSFRNFVAQARLEGDRQENEAFFGRMLGDVDEPTLPYGLLQVQGDGSGIGEARLRIEEQFGQRLRTSARKAGVSAASLCHLAWAKVLARVSGRNDVVFGTVLFGRMHQGEGASEAMGLFINTLPIRIVIGEQSVSASVRETHELLGRLLEHEHATLAVAQRCSAVAAPAPLFSTLLNYRHNSVALAPSEGIKAVFSEERTNYPLTLSVDDVGERFQLTVQVEAPIEAMRVCKMMHQALEGLVGALEHAPQTPIRSVEVLPQAERIEVVERWNETKAEYPSEQCIHELFEAQVEKAPEAVALVYEGQELSYGELNARANQVGHYLRQLGVKPEERVAICVELGLEMVVGLLGVVKAGGAYVPLDPEYPDERLSYMLEDSEPMALLTQGKLAERLNGLNTRIPVLDLTAPELEWADQPATNLDPSEVGLTSRHLAYVIYTSGSTGQPKGVMVEHRSIANATDARTTAYGPLGRFLLISPISFDSSAAGIFGTLSAGGTLVVADKDAIRDPFKLRRCIATFQIDSLLCIPSLYHQLLDCDHASGGINISLSLVIVAGETCSESLATESARCQPHTKLYNEYGPTEATVWTAHYKCKGGGQWTQRVPIGRPIANTHIYILDGYGEPVPVGVVGELYIGGAGVARGYLNRPELTAERFLADPFSRERSARMYRTGDLGRWLPDGNIEFIGRNDFQVKIRGFRIELGEIEANLAEHPGVSEAVVVAREDEPGDKRLIAYYVAKGAASARGDNGERDKSQGTVVSAADLREHLGESLPEYMVPAAYVRLEALPLTPNGKVDRKSLPAPETDAYVQRGYEAPQGEVETTLAQIWGELLKVEQVGRHDNFFELGGHSLLVMKSISCLRQTFGVHIHVRTLFTQPTLVSLAEHIVEEQIAQFDPDDLRKLCQSVPEDKRSPLFASPT